MKKIASLLMTVVLLATMLTVFAVPASAAEHYVKNGNELQKVIDNAQPGSELHIKIDCSWDYYYFVIENTIDINKSLKIYIENARDDGWGVDPSCDTGSCFRVSADNVELHFGENILIYGNYHNLGYGEGIYVDGNNCLIDGASFWHCGDFGWYNEDGNPYDGAAIYVDGKDCTIQNCKFENCHSYDGGAICVNQHNCHVVNCSFIDCKAFDYGGAIYVCSGTYGFVASHCSFDKVWAVDYGHYISGARDAKVFDCSPHWGEEEYYSKWVTFETADPLGDYRRNNPSSRLHPAYPEDGYYVIRSAVDTNYCFDIAGGANAKSDGDNLRLWPADTSTGKIFEIKKDGDAYKIIAVQSGKVLDIEGKSTADGANVYQWTDYGTSNQRWIFEDDPLAENCYYIHSLQGGNGGWLDAAGCVDGVTPRSDGGTNIYSWSYTGAKNQMWILEKVDYNPPVGFTLSEGTIAIITGVAGLAVGFLVAMFIFKKKKPVLASDETTDDAEKSEE